LNQLSRGRDVCGDFDRADEHEWLVTNGLGGFASGTVGDVNTRRYHGLLNRVTCDGATFHPDPAWYWNFKHRAESARGLDDSEDLFRPGRFMLTLEEGERATMVMSADSSEAEAFAAVQGKLRARQDALLKAFPDGAPDWVRQLALASDQFIVERHMDGKPVGETVIAGYPWFGDWGRDTMIALPGLALATRRYDVAAGILRTFAAHISEGMLPNRFPDNANAQALEYNTVEVNALWYNALMIMADLAGRLGKSRQAKEYKEYRAAAALVRSNFARFWNDKLGCLYDVIDGLEGEIHADGRRAAAQTARLFRAGLERLGGPARLVEFTRSRLMNRYLELSTYPEAPDVLRRLKDAGMRLAILSNGSLECWRPRLQVPATPI